ncbi:MAG TPA: acyl-CoA thioesterase/bile acid-CoA:amino acid N-acyltransferase family protein [Micromonosporaceae bacterium]|jgi:dienelactone hydrolase
MAGTVYGVPVHRGMRIIVALTIAATGLTGCGLLPSNLSISAGPTVTLVDEPVHVTVAGAAAHANVTVTATEIGEDGVVWSSHATFKADAHGRVDLNKVAPISGSYTGVDGGGLLWSMTDPLTAPIDDMLQAPAEGTASLKFVAASAHRRSGRVIVRRTQRSAGVTVTTPDADFVGAYAVPADAPPGPAVVLWGGSEGGLSTYGDATMFASHGIRALALAYFDDSGLPKDLKKIPIEYFELAVSWLASQPGVEPGKIVIDGTSRGGEAALLTGLHDPQVAGVISIVGDDSVGPATNTDGDGLGASAWTYDGIPLPYSPSMVNEGQASALIPVAKIPVPILGACGLDDGIQRNCLFLQDLMKRRGKHAGDRFFVFPGVGHEIGANWPYESGNYVGAEEVTFGVTAAADQKVRMQLWPAILNFIKNIPAHH